MNRIPKRPVHSFVACAAVLLSAGFLISCGDSKEEPAQKLTFERYAPEFGAKVTGPKKAKAGVTEITFRNNSSGKADLQLIRVEGDHSLDEVIDGLKKSTKGKRFPDWFFAAGGIGLTETGETPTVTQVLRPGTYYALNTETLLSPKNTAVIEVTGESPEDEPPEGEETIEATEYSFESDGTLHSGTNEIRFDNVGKQPHHLLAAKLIGEATAKDVEEDFKSKDGNQPPLQEKGLQTTAVVEGGEGQLVTFELEPGRYALFCFISDRQGGPPHALKGMVDEIEVEKAEEE